MFRWGLHVHAIQYVASCMLVADMCTVGFRFHLSLYFLFITLCIESTAAGPRVLSLCTVPDGAYFVLLCQISNEIEIEMDFLLPSLLLCLCSLTCTSERRYNLILLRSLPQVIGVDPVTPSTSVDLRPNLSRHNYAYAHMCASSTDWFAQTSNLHHRDATYVDSSSLL